MAGHGGWEGRGGGYRPSQVVSRYLKAAGYTVNNNLRREGMRVRTLGTDQVSIWLDYDVAHDDLPEQLMAVLDVLVGHGYRVHSIDATASSARAVVHRAPLKRVPRKVTRTDDS